MKTLFRVQTLATGLAMFSMFFGAGNVMFPLLLGQRVGDQNWIAMVGLLITAVGVPLLGLMSMTLFRGDYHKFFSRIGRVPGLFVAIVIMLILGPFGAIPRCVGLSYDTAVLTMPSLSLAWFNLGAVFVIFIFAWKESRVIDLLGYALTPLLLFSLCIIIVMGWIGHPAAQPVDLSGGRAFLIGFLEGYNTLDLMAAMFFATVVVASLKLHFAGEERQEHRRLVAAIALRASCIAGFLLALIYIGLSFAAAYYAPYLEEVGGAQLLGALAYHLLGPYAGWVANIAVALTCLTTSLALAAVFADFLQHEILRGRISYLWSLLITLVITYLMSYLRFSGIVKFVSPIAVAFYPALIMLAICNLLYKLYDFKPVKVPVYTVFALTLIIWGVKAL
jgi:branched-chain amino acid:cation transporter, LIVCS family